MNRTYKLYSVEEMNGIMVLRYVTTTFARNIIEAEYLFKNEMKPGCEYQITILG